MERRILGNVSLETICTLVEIPQKIQACGHAFSGSPSFLTRFRSLRSNALSGTPRAFDTRMRALDFGAVLSQVDHSISKGVEHEHVPLAFVSPSARAFTPTDIRP